MQSQTNCDKIYSIVTILYAKMCTIYHCKTIEKHYFRTNLFWSLLFGHRKRWDLKIVVKENVGRFDKSNQLNMVRDSMFHCIIYITLSQISVVNE